MKKTILLIALALTTVVSVNAQKKYATYTSLSKTINSSVTEKGTIYLDLNSNGKYGIILKKSDRVKFIEFLNKSRKKYLEWKKKAIDNEVNDVNKDIDKITFKGFFDYGGWNFGLSSLTSIFSVNKKGVPYFYLYGSKITSSSNKYIKSSSTILSITKEKDFNSLIKVLEEKTIQDFLSEKNKKEKLFN